MTPQKRKVLSLVVAVQVVMAAAAWRDLGRRDAERVRGAKTFWRVFVSLNPGNALFYWLFGRRRIAPQV
jgi:hypothetical protein